jgi:hypothetical protein
VENNIRREILSISAQGNKLLLSLSYNYYSLTEKCIGCPQLITNLIHDSINWRSSLMADVSPGKVRQDREEGGAIYIISSDPENTGLEIAGCHVLSQEIY